MNTITFGRGMFLTPDAQKVMRKLTEKLPAGSRVETVGDPVTHVGTMTVSIPGKPPIELSFGANRGSEAAEALAKIVKSPQVA